MSRIKYEREFRKLVEQRGFLTVRSAGSFGKADVWVMDDNNTAAMVEVKSTTDNKFKVSHSKERIEQYKELKRLREAGRNVIYAIRWLSHAGHRGKDQAFKWGIYDPVDQKHMARKYPVFHPNKGDTISSYFEGVGVNHTTALINSRPKKWVVGRGD